MTIRPEDQVYIAGPMTGLVDDNKAAFHKMERKLFNVFGCNVLNPARNFEGEKNVSRSRYIQAGCNQVNNLATAIVFLSGWTCAHGALLEFYLGVQRNLRLFDGNFEPLSTPSIWESGILDVKVTRGIVERPHAMLIT